MTNTISFSLVIPIAVVFFMIGCWIGSAIEAARWRDNADSIQRIESKGRLYRVTRL